MRDVPIPDEPSITLSYSQLYRLLTDAALRSRILDAWVNVALNSISSVGFADTPAPPMPDEAYGPQKAMR